MNKLRVFNYTGIADCVEFLLSATAGELGAVARELAEGNPELTDRIADMLIDAVYDAAQAGDSPKPT